jgi:hypothetical protein
MEDQEKPTPKGKPGRKPVKGDDLRKFLATLEAETIKGLKLAAIQEGSTASEYWKRPPQIGWSGGSRRRGSRDYPKHHIAVSIVSTSGLHIAMSQSNFGRWAV